MSQLLIKKYFLPFSLIILLTLYACEKNYDTIIDSTGSAPYLTDASYSLSVINTDTINVGPERKPEDLLTIRGIGRVKVVHAEGKSDISSVTCSVTNILSSDPKGKGTLHDNGIFPDISPDDSIYSGYIEFSINRVEVGKFFAEITSESCTGYQSITILVPFQVVRQNHPPVLSYLLVDTLIALGGVDHLSQIRVVASDPDGRSDVLKVFFNSFKPDGSPSTGNPFMMYDDGDANQISGDQVAGDGNYGLIIFLPKTTQIGTYRFEFHAIDRSYDSSNVLIRNIVVTN